MKYSRAYLHPLAGKDPVVARIITEHNIVFMMSFMDKIRTAIRENALEEFTCRFLKGMYPEADNVKPPSWVRDCLVRGAGFESVNELFRWDDSSLQEGHDNPHIAS